MNHVEEPFLSQIRNAESDKHAFQVLQAITRQMGYAYCTYCVRMPLPLSRRQVIWYDNYPDARDAPPAAPPDDSDWPPLLDDGCWADGLPDTLPLAELIPSQRARDAGARIDWAKAIHSPNGATGMLTLARAAASAPEGMTHARYRVVDMLLEAAHTRITGVLFGRLMPEAGAKMSPRELEVLRWIGDGKTSDEIAMIMGLSPATVNFHIKRLVEKMSSSNRTHAAVKAVALGILTAIPQSIPATLHQLVA